MTMITETAIKTFSPREALSAALRFVASKFESRRTLAELNAMEDFMLRDIGLTRADLTHASVAKLSSDPMVVLKRARMRTA